MISLAKSVKKTISYADFFNFPVSTDDIYLWLISSSRVDRKRIEGKHPLMLTGKEKKYRDRLKEISFRKIDEAKNLCSILKIIPTISMVSVTGSVAINNPKQNDDIDLLIVTKNHTLWVTRAIVTLIILLSGRKRHPKALPKDANNTFCLNLWLEESALYIPTYKQSLYTAHEVLQALPVYDRSNTSHRFLTINRWVKKYLANAYYEKTKQSKNKLFKDDQLMNNLFFLFSPINYLFYLLQLFYMKPKITTETIALDHAYFHKIDFSDKIKKYLDAN